ncbi:MAG: hypothetical protein II996_03490 [Oscillospiraceae bacterium]|nr:hypothetical protein [Oscillospiraceae bacterium]
MIKKIRVMLDYGCYPVWLYDEADDLVDTLLPEELRSNAELDAKFDDLQARYEALFINNSKEFSFVGFESESERDKFLSDWKSAVDALTVATHGTYEVCDEIKKAFGS